MALSREERADTVLGVVERDLLRVVQGTSGDHVRVALADGDLCALVQGLGTLFLTSEQQEHIERIIHLYHQCCCPLEYQRERDGLRDEPGGDVLGMPGGSPALALDPESEVL